MSEHRNQNPQHQQSHPNQGGHQQGGQKPGQQTQNPDQGGQQQGGQKPGQQGGQHQDR